MSPCECPSRSQGGLPQTLRRRNTSLIAVHLPVGSKAPREADVLVPSCECEVHPACQTCRVGMCYLLDLEGLEFPDLLSKLVHSLSPAHLTSHGNINKRCEQVTHPGSNQDWQSHSLSISPGLLDLEERRDSLYVALQTGTDNSKLSGPFPFGLKNNSLGTL